MDSNTFKLSVVLGSLTSIALYYSIRRLRKYKRAHTLLYSQGFKQVSHIYDKKYNRNSKHPKFIQSTKQLSKMEILLEGKVFTKSKVFVDNMCDLPTLGTVRTYHKKNYLNFMEAVNSPEKIKDAFFSFITDFDSEYKIDIIGNNNKVLRNLYHINHEKTEETKRSFFHWFIYTLENYFQGSTYFPNNLCIRENELSLNINTPIFVFGTAFLEKKKGFLSFKPSVLVAGSFKDFETLLSAKMNEAFLLSGVSLLATLFFFREFIFFASDVIVDMVKSQRMKRMRKRMARMSDIEIDDITCIICFNAVRNVVVMPCKHICMCDLCFKELQTTINKDKCPICKTKVKGTIQWNFA